MDSNNTKHEPGERESVRRSWATVVSLVLLLCLSGYGCAQPKLNASAQLDAASGNVTICFGKDYFGPFGDGRKEWTSQNHPKYSTSFVAHIPTRSEFYISARTLPFEAATTKTNELIGFAEDIRRKAGGQTATNTYEILKHSRHYTKGGNEIKDAADYTYLRSEFVGRRLVSEHYGTNDPVSIVLFVTDLNPEFNKPASGRVFVAMAMMPLETDSETRVRLLGVFRKFLDELRFFVVVNY